MGIETKLASNVYVPLPLYLEAPYGNWNIPVSSIIYGVIFNLEAPYGNWNHYPKIKKSTLKKFRSSLWELKPIYLFWRDDSLIDLEAPYGNWNWVYCFFSSFAFDLEAPYGNWNHIPKKDKTAHQNLEAPYGNWNA